MPSRKRGRPRSVRRAVERRLRGSYPSATDRTIRNAAQVDKVVAILRPKRFALAWLLRPQEDGTLRPRRSVCYALGAIVRTTTRRVRSDELASFVKKADEMSLTSINNLITEGRITEALHALSALARNDTRDYDVVALDVFAERLCAIRPDAAEAMRLVREWRRHWIHLRDRAIEKAAFESVALESVAADAIACQCWRK